MQRSFEELGVLFQEYLHQYSIGDEPKGLYEPAQYILDLGGKRLRPLLVLAACELYGTAAEEALPVALSVEVFHNFSLVHDDIMDKAPVRRGKATIHEKWNLNTAILSGDALLVEAYRLLCEAPHPLIPDVLQSFSSMARNLCEGQQLDIEFEERGSVKADEYLEMIEGKTSVLIGCALQLGGIVGGASPSSLDHLYSFGLELGLAFQIMDDWLDCFGDSKLTGKQTGGDILAGKHTLLHILAKENKSFEKELSNALSQSKPEQKVAAVMEVYNQSGAAEECKAKSQLLYQSSLLHLEKALPSGVNGKPFKEFAYSLVERNF